MSLNQMELNNPMTSESALRQDGKGLSIALAKHITERHGLHEGDPVLLVETAEGILLVTGDVELAYVMEVAERTNHRYEDA